MEDWKDDRIEWYAEDLVDLGYIFNETEWNRFREALNDCSMEFFLEMQIDDEMFNLTQVDVDLDNFELTTNEVTDNG